MDGLNEKGQRGESLRNLYTRKKIGVGKVRNDTSVLFMYYITSILSETLVEWDPRVRSWIVPLIGYYSLFEEKHSLNKLRVHRYRYEDLTYIIRW